MKHLLVCLSFGLTLVLSGCGPKAFTDGAYDDPNRVELMDDKFNEADMQQMAKTIVDAIIDCPDIQESRTRPKIAVSTVQNRTEEYPDLDALTEMIQVDLSKSRKVQFIDRGSRGELDEEYEYSRSGRVSKETQKKAGKQIGVDYLLKGALATNVQQVGNDKLIYYILTMQLTNLETSAIDCTEKVEVRKKYRKKSLGIF
ncbi:MAG: penicillin-binding protein activator LpoB [Oligoflexia bacterium]|nr:penicillin-binding protein activator LpoB [Oligoflexia bacterium]